MSKHFLGDAKIDLPAHEIFVKFEGTPTDRALIAEYAAKDTVLPLKLLVKLHVIENLFEMANATYCPATYVLTRGQQIKVFSVLMRKARAMGYACPDGVGIGVQGKFTGATVLNAERGAYFDIVSGLDFCSRELHGGRGYGLSAKNCWANSIFLFHRQGTVSESPREHCSVPINNHGLDARLLDARARRQVRQPARRGVLRGGH